VLFRSALEKTKLVLISAHHIADHLPMCYAYMYWVVLTDSSGNPISTGISEFR